MEEKKGASLPENWEEMIYAQRAMWFMLEYATDELDEDRNLIYDTDRMPEEVLEAYKDVIEGHRKAKNQGILID